LKYVYYHYLTSWLDIKDTSSSKIKLH
jgi:hypothetical protein